MRFKFKNILEKQLLLFFITIIYVLQPFIGIFEAAMHFLLSRR